MAPGRKCNKAMKSGRRCANLWRPLKGPYASGRWCPDLDIPQPVGQVSRAESQLWCAIFLKPSWGNSFCVRNENNTTKRRSLSVLIAPFVNRSSQDINKPDVTIKYQVLPWHHNLYAQIFCAYKYRDARFNFTIDCRAVYVQIISETRAKLHLEWRIS